MEFIRVEERVKPIFYLATLFARLEAKTRARQRHWLKLVSEKIRREQIGTVPTFFLFARTKSLTNKVGGQPQSAI